jgi:ATP-binding cassette, subfamily B (MDR/TAP), member 1
MALVGFLSSSPPPENSLKLANKKLFAYGITGLLVTNDPAYVRSHSNLIALMWFVVGIVEFFGYASYAWCFGFCSQRMVRRVRFASFRAILRQNAAFFDRAEHTTGTLTQMLGQEATAMAGLSGQNLGAILTIIFGLTSSCISWRISPLPKSPVPPCLPKVRRLQSPPNSGDTPLTS